MIGQFTIPGTDVVCTLDDNLEWQATRPETQALLRDLYDPGMPPYSSPSVGSPGCFAVSDAAHDFGADPTFGPEEPGEPGAVY